MAGDRVDSLGIFGATGDLAALETFPALVGPVERVLTGCRNRVPAVLSWCFAFNRDTRSRGGQSCASTPSVA